MRKLKLQKETIRRLNDNDLSGVVGGFAFNAIQPLKSPASPDVPERIERMTEVCQTLGCDTMSCPPGPMPEPKPLNTLGCYGP